MRVVEVEDEHAEARFVAAEIARCVERGLRASREIAVVYRTNAQSRVLEDMLVRQGIDYQVIGGPRFYERAEIKDAIAYLQVIDNPDDAVSLVADREPAAARRGGHVARAARRRSPTATAISLWEALGRAEEVGPRDRVAARGAVAAHAAPVADGGRARAAACASSSSACSSGPATSRRSRPSGRSRRAGGSRTSRSSSASRASTRSRTGGDEPSLSQFLQEISLYSAPGRRCRRRERRPGDADDAAQREGARVPRRLHARDGGGDLPALALDRGERRSRRSGGSATSA